jgi:hypothetical protein
MPIAAARRIAGSSRIGIQASDTILSCQKLHIHADFDRRKESADPESNPATASM